MTGPSLRYPLLDGLRWGAAFWVMSFHYLAGPSGDLHWYRYGHLGAQLFFVISGFVILHSLRGTTLRQFAIGRFIRLFPLFWVMCTATYLFTVLATASPVSFGEYLVNMTMIGPKALALGQGARLVDPSYWSLEVELMFYAAVTAFVFTFSYDRLRYFLASWLTLSIVLFLWHADRSLLGRLAQVQHAPYFVFGGALALIVMRHAATRLQTWTDRAMLLLSGTWATLTFTRIFPSAYALAHPLDATMATAIHAIMFASVILLVYMSRYVRDPQAIRRLGILGGITYPLYLMHLTIGTTLIEYLVEAHSVPAGPAALGVGTMMMGFAYGAFVKDQQLRGWLRVRLQRSSPEHEPLPVEYARAALQVDDRVRQNAL